MKNDDPGVRHRITIITHDEPDSLGAANPYQPVCSCGAWNIDTPARLELGLRSLRFADEVTAIGYGVAHINYERDSRD